MGSERQRPSNAPPPALLSQCETMLEEFEDVVGDWYFHHQEQPLQHFLCERHVLPASETGKCKGQAPPLASQLFPALTLRLFSSHSTQLVYGKLGLERRRSVMGRRRQMTKRRKKKKR